MIQKLIKNWIMDHLRIVYVVRYEKDGIRYILDMSNCETYAKGICELHAELNPIIKRDLCYVRSKYATYEPKIVKDWYRKMHE